MRVGILGKKIGCTQIFDSAGNLVPVTVVDTSGCYVTQVKGGEKDKYSALQLGIGERKPQNVNKAARGHFSKAGVSARASLQEMRFEDTEVPGLTAGTELSPAIFQVGDRVDVTGNTRGLGFAGVMKRYGYAGKHATHGTSKYFRHGGSNGSNTFPGRVLKNKGMPGRKGAEKRTIPNLEVVGVNVEDKVLLIRGKLPGARQSIVTVRLSRKMDHKARSYNAAEAAPQDK